MRQLDRLFLYAFFLSATCQVSVLVSARERGPVSSRQATASIAGTVIDSTTGEPLQGVHVRLVASGENGPSAAYGAMSDAAGHFSITGLPPSPPPFWYSITSEYRGFVMVRGKRGSRAANGDLELKPGEHVQDVTLRMMPRAILSGRVLDEYGEPMLNIFVKAFPVTPGTLNRFLDPPITNDRGEFRIGVEPGKYYILAGSTPMEDERSQTVRSANTAESTYLFTYYPSATETAAATVVEVKPGRETSGLEIRLARTLPLNVTGVVVGAADCASAPSVVAVPKAEGSDSPGETFLALTDASNPRSWDKFLLSRLAPGAFRVYAYCAADGHVLKSQTVELTLTDSNVENVSLALVRGPDIKDVTGKVRWTASSRLSKRKEGLSVKLMPEGVFREHFRAADVAPDGTFKIKDVPPDRYRVEVDVPDNGFVMTIRLGEKLVQDGILDFTNGAGEAKLRITLSTNGAQVTGWVTDDDAEETPSSFGSVVIFSDQESAAFSDWSTLYQFYGTDGAYGLGGLRPGRYRLLATPQTFGSKDEVKDFLRQNLGRGEVIEIKKEGEKVSKDLKMPVEDAGEMRKDETRN